MSYSSWGNYPDSEPALVRTPFWLDDVETDFGALSYLPYGLGRSYGDSCLNNDNALLVTRALDRVINFDTKSGVLHCEAGLSLAAILELIVPKGWFLPVTPGTKFVTVGGAIANDVHGKNHHLSGTFGAHVAKFDLLRSDGSRTTCSAKENAELYKATIGGLGLTGIILSAQIQLRPIAGPFVDVENITFTSLDEFFELSKESAEWEYTVAWLDTTYASSSLGRGIFMRGKHSEVTAEEKKINKPRVSSVPAFAPNFALNPLSVSAFNWAYFHKQRTKVQKVTAYYEPFFYPLDAVRNWNRIYGKRGFLQFQCVVPSDSNHEALKQIIQKVTESKKASFLAVIKEFGAGASPGMLSFPRPGTTVCLDFPFQGSRTLSFFAELELLARDCGGALYPAKDACMSAETFKTSYPNYQEFIPYIDPKCSSSFWRRVMEAS